ncbi:hypothetical protein [Proteiniphilum sp. UBA5384]|uniref:hypothetical protein n=1 Tax=Proteiniphilum sp. UBA5384 TaxID=1947279 RepID=UPI0025E815FF|nr:hypothetical protein [Proteiniphilum sp. UBA5384]
MKRKQLFKVLKHLFTLFKHKVSWKKEIVVPDLELKELSIMLSDAVVVGKMPEVIVKEDTLEYNPA